MFEVGDKVKLINSKWIDGNNGDSGKNKYIGGIYTILRTETRLYNGEYFLGYVLNNSEYIWLKENLIHVNKKSKILKR